MATNFADLKKNRTSFADIATKMKETTAKKSYIDNRFWEPTVDKAGNGFAVIRFLPATEGEEIPWVQIFTHGFKGFGGWYIENCPTTIGKPCPACEANNILWATNLESNKTIVRGRKRKLSNISNILVVQDKAKPETEGGVFLFKYGKKIFEKTSDLASPEFPDQVAVNPFDLWEGANFNLRIRFVDGYRNYDKSDFSQPTPIAKTDKEIEAIWKKQYKLQPLIAPDQFKDYEVLKRRIIQVLGTEAVGNKQIASEPSQVSEPRPVLKPQLPVDVETPPWEENVSDDDAETLAYLKKIAQEQD